MSGRSLRLAVALTLLEVLSLSACSSTLPVPTGGDSPGKPAAHPVQSGEPVTGREVTKDVPHSTETILDIREREAKEPLPPRGDVAIPYHRIQRGDNAVAPPPPAVAPCGVGIPADAGPPQTGGYR